jgi:hypothetical protein
LEKNKNVQIMQQDICTYKETTTSKAMWYMYQFNTIKSPEIQPHIHDHQFVENISMQFRGERMIWFLYKPCWIMCIYAEKDEP